jgi:hypothetical protein
MQPIAVTASLLRGLVPDLPLREGATLMARVASRGEQNAVIVLAGVPLTAQVPPEVQAGATLRLKVQEVTPERITLQIDPQGSETAPQGTPTPPRAPVQPAPGGYAPPPPRAPAPPAAPAPLPGEAGEAVPQEMATPQTPGQPAARPGTAPPGAPAPLPGEAIPRQGVGTPAQVAAPHAAGAVPRAGEAAAPSAAQGHAPAREAAQPAAVQPPGIPAAALTGQPAPPPQLPPAEVKVEEPPARRRGPDGQPADVVALAFTSPALGRLDLRLELRGDKLLADVTTDAGLPFAVANGARERLRAKLAEAGLEPTVKVQPRHRPFDVYA